MNAAELTMAEDWLREAHPTAHIVREFSVSEYGGALVDVAAILEDRIVGVEVKGEGDSPTRLPLQGMMYSRVCRSVFLLAAPSLRTRCAKHCPPGWGQLSIEPESAYGWKQSGAIWCKRHHDQDKGYGLAPVALAAMPWTNEYGAFSAAIGWTVPKRKSDCIRAVAQHEPLPKIERAVCHVLRNRIWSKDVSLPADPPPAPAVEKTAYERACEATGRLVP